MLFLEPPSPLFYTKHMVRNIENEAIAVIHLPTDRVVVFKTKVTDTPQPIS